MSESYECQRGTIELHSFHENNVTLARIGI